MGGHEFPPRPNIAPTQPVVIVRGTQESGRGTQESGRGTQQDVRNASETARELTLGHKLINGIPKRREQ